MIGIRPLLVTTLVLLAATSARSDEIPIVFTITKSERLASIGYSNGDTSRQTIRHSGTIDAQLTFDPTTQRATAIRFTGANISESPSTFRNVVDVYIPGIGTKTVTFEASSSGLKMRLETIGSAHPIAFDGRILDSYRLKSLPTEGILTAKITIDGRPQTQQIDVATNPPGYSEPYSGTLLKLAVTETARREASTDYEIAFTIEVNDTQVSDLPDNNGTITKSISGYNKAVATFAVPNHFGQWLLDNGYTLEDTNAADSRGHPLALLYAFRLSPKSHQGLPWRFEPEADGSLNLALQLPSNGLQRAIRLEACDDLATGQWHTLQTEDFLNGNSSLDLGAYGERRIHFPNTHSIYYRIVPASTAN